MTYEVKNPEIRALLKETGDSIHKMMPEGWGFALLIFSFGDGGDMFYLSDARRPDMLEAMKEFIAKQERDFPENT